MLGSGLTSSLQKQPCQKRLFGVQAWGNLEIDMRLSPGRERRREMEEKQVGKVVKFFAKIGVAAIRLSEGSLKVGDKIHIVGHTTDVTLAVDSMQVENQSVAEAGIGADVGIKITDRVREHDVVYKVVG